VLSLIGSLMFGDVSLQATNFHFRGIVLAVAPIHAKNNNFGGLRLLFACLVILSHSPSILTGNAALEPHFGPMTLGQIAVDRFFVISGYLITKSFVGSAGVLDYFSKRALRIYPGFVVNGLLCLFVLSPLVGAGAAVFQFPKILNALLRLSILTIHQPGVFPNMPMPALNGPAWTIPYEFRCYILVAALGVVGTYRRMRSGLVIAAFASMIISALNVLPEASGPLYVAFGSPIQTVRLTGAFMCGMGFFLYRDHIPYAGAIAAPSAAVLLASAFVPVTTELAAVSLGGYLVFWFALHFRPLRVSIWANETDLSYGIYLYGWPVQMAIVYVDRSITSWTLSFLALGVSAVLAYFSWTFIEKPALGLVHRRREHPLPVAVSDENRWTTSSR
jgi:peptidoglycan/LPS O-acetylase OafA/YrhL